MLNTGNLRVAVVEPGGDVEDVGGGARLLQARMRNTQNAAAAFVTQDRLKRTTQTH